MGLYFLTTLYKIVYCSSYKGAGFLAFLYLDCRVMIHYCYLILIFIVGLYSWLHTGCFPIQLKNYTGDSPHIFTSENLYGRFWDMECWKLKKKHLKFWSDFFFLQHGSGLTQTLRITCRWSRENSIPSNKRMILVIIGSCELYFALIIIK